MIRKTFVAAMVVAAVGVLATPAGAKGVDSATLTGPGLPSSGISLTGRYQQLYSVLGSVMSGPGKFPTHYGVRTRDLGPRYTLTVTLDGFPGGSTLVRTYVYPYAKSGSAWTYTPAGQRPNPEGPELAGGWLRTNPGFTHFLVLHGLPRHMPVVAARQARTGGGSSVVLATAVGIGGALIFWTALSMARRRRSS